MTRRMRPYCASAVLFFFLFFLLAPDEARGFDSDALKTAGIVSGITVGVALLIVLIAGTAHDLKKDRDDPGREEEDWSQSPVLRTLGYRPLDDPLFKRPGAIPEGPSPEPLSGLGELGAFQAGRDEPVRFEGSACLHAPDPGRLDLRCMSFGIRPARASLAREAAQPGSSLGRPRSVP